MIPVRAEIVEETRAAVVDGLTRTLELTYAVRPELAPGLEAAIAITKEMPL